MASGILDVAKKIVRTAADKAVETLSSDPGLQKSIEAEFAKLGAGQDEILRVLAAQDETLRGIGAAVDKGFSEQNQQMEAILADLRDLKLKVSLEAPRADAAANLSIDEIFLQSNAYQQDAMKWISGGELDIASQRLQQGRELALNGLRREPNSAKMLVTLGYIEKSQAQVIRAGAPGDPVERLSEAAKFFVKALEADSEDVNAMNGIANVYLFSKDYDRAVKMGLLVVQKQPAYGAAAWDLSMALEGKIQQEGVSSEWVPVLRSVYKLLETLMPLQPEMFPASYLAYVQQRMAALGDGPAKEPAKMQKAAQD